jgi:hypothetical protein
VTRGEDERGGAPRLEGECHAEWFDVGHNAFQFIVDCYHESGQAQGSHTVYFRVTADASNARELFRQLGTSLLRYADAYGPIGPADELPRHDA